MPLASPHRRRRIATRLIAGWLACALVICGLASVRIAMLGTNHVHLQAASAAAQAMAGWQDFRRAAHLGGGPRDHHHAFLERHHHDAVDTSVASADAPGSAAVSGDAGGAASLPVIALATAPAWPAAPLLTGADTRRAGASAHGIELIESGRLERPPRG
ncbi:MAG: hypothetical protein V4844_09595 [Pseudomonadota bacterium]